MPDIKRVWSYDPNTGVLIGPEVADESPLEAGVYHVPANCTAVAPPSPIPAGHVAKFNPAKRSWVVEPVVIVVNALPPKTFEELKSIFNSWRKALLGLTDWAILPDTELSDDDQLDAIAYRQALRAMPRTSESDVTHPQWPTVPACLNNSDMVRAIAEINNLNA